MTTSTESRAGRPRQFAEAVGLHAEPHAVDRLSRRGIPSRPTPAARASRIRVVSACHSRSAQPSSARREAARSVSRSLIQRERVQRVAGRDEHVLASVDHVGLRRVASPGRSRVCHSGLPFAGSNAMKLPDTSPPNSSLPAVVSSPGAPRPSADRCGTCASTRSCRSCSRWR